MTPAPNQRASSGNQEYDTEAEKLVDQKSDRTLFAVITGIEDPDRAQEFVKAAGEHNDTGPTIVRAAYERAQALRQTEPDAERGESAA